MTVTANRSRPAWVLPLIAWASLLAFALLLGTYARSPEMPAPPGSGRTFPRVASPPSLDILLWFLGVGSVVWYAVFLALPLLLWLARKIDSGRLGRAATVAIVIAGLLALIALTSFVQLTITYHGAPGRPDFIQYLPEALRRNVLPWVALIGIVFAVETRRRAVNVAVDRERMRAQLAEQRLVTLTSQLQPHFLFNTLQGISTLIHRDPAAADEMLGKLADLLRNVLRDRERVLVPLEEEMRYARTYLEIAKLRFGERLAYDIDVEPGLDHTLVPLFILQPLVENALGHGIGARMRGGRVGIAANAVEGHLHLKVSDDGDSLGSSAITDGIGLSNTRERLRASFGEDASLSLENRDGMTIALVVTPLRSLEAIRA